MQFLAWQNFLLRVSAAADTSQKLTTLSPVAADKRCSPLSYLQWFYPHIYFKEESYARNKKLMEELKPDIDKIIESAKRDTSRSEVKMMMMQAPPKEDYSN